jgi:hypothetical protein
MMRSSLTLAALAVALCSAAPLRAQANLQPYIPVGVDSVHAAPDSGVMSTAPATGASLTGLRSAAHKAESNRALQPTMMATRGNLGQARSLMIVGAAAFIAGAIIEGDAGRIFMVGGAIVGLYGLYEYLQ